MNIEIHQYWFKNLHIEWRDETPHAENPAIKTDGIQTEIDYDVLASQQSPLNYKIEMRIKILTMQNEKPVGYTVVATLVGLFELGSNVPAENRQFLVRVNGIGMLYGALRGVIANTTATCEGGVFFLPAISPQDIVDRVERRKAALRAQKQAEAKDKSVSEASAAPAESK